MAWTRVNRLGPRGRLDILKKSLDQFVDKTDQDADA